MHPGVFLRAKAAAIDGLIILCALLLVSYIFTFIPNASNAIRIGSFITFAILYDPLLTSTKGQTLGHMIMGIKVVRYSDTERLISFIPALMRYLLKAILGWVSLVTIGGNKDSRAIHDLACNSQVIYKS